ncbi:MAG: hypothetical protein ACTHK7_24435 [Aureliella sp.]
MVMVFPCGGATCARRRPMAEFTPPIVFEETPTLEQLIEHLNRTQAIERLNCGTITLSSAEVSTELSGNLSWHRSARFRLQAYPGATRMLGDALDAGSNEEAFWLLTKIPGERHTLYFARHDQFDTQTGPRRILPVSPLWIREALGVIEFDPAWHHEGPLARPDGKMEIRSTIPTPRGSYQRIVIVEPTRATIQQLVLIDPDGKMVASAQQSEHSYYSAIDTSLPHRVDLQLKADDGPVLAFTVRIGNYIINEVMGDENLRYAMPDPTGLQVVDLVQANTAVGQSQPVPPNVPTRSAAQSNWMSNAR